MGNHDVGRAMAGAAEAFWVGNGDAPVTKEKALSVLDAAGLRWVGTDAEFDDEFLGETPLSRLVAIAFDATPEQIDDLKNATAEGEAWFDGPYSAFRQRYKFC